MFLIGFGTFNWRYYQQITIIGRVALMQEEMVRTLAVLCLVFVVGCQTTSATNTSSGKGKLPANLLQHIESECIAADRDDAIAVHEATGSSLPLDEFLNSYCECFTREVGARVTAEGFLEVVADVLLLHPKAGNAQTMALEEASAKHPPISRSATICISALTDAAG